MNTLKEKVMRRVYALYVLRQLSHPAVRVGTLLVALFALRELTFVSKVLENASLKHDMFQSAGYLVYAFTGTELIVQSVVVAVIVATLWMMKDAATLFLRPRLA